MWLRVDLRSHMPMYQQIIDSVKEQIARGQLKSGERLPTVRELANDLSVNHNTVAKAYQELERENVIELIRGRGTFVSTFSEIPNIETRKRELRDAIKKWIVDAHHLHLSEGEIMAIFHKTLSEFHENKGGDVRDKDR